MKTTYRFVLASGLLLCIGVAGSCEGVAGSAEGFGPQRAALSSALEDGSVPWGTQPEVRFEACADAPELECGTLHVPVYYADPPGGSMAVSVLRARATGDRLGVLFVNFGGPGGFQVETLKGVADTSLAGLRERFDLVTFDPRGSAPNTDALRCDFVMPVVKETAEPAARAAYLDEHARRFHDACETQSEWLFYTMSTTDIARDLDLLRIALREDKLSYWGISYGAELGAVYASMFPEDVRAMLLDSGATPDLDAPLLQVYAEEAAAFELALAHIDQLCRADTACPLHDEGITAPLEQVLQTLRTAPVSSPDGTALLNAEAAAKVVYLWTINERRFWSALPARIAQARAGDYSGWFDYVLPSDVGTDRDLQVYSAITCSDLAGARMPASEFMPTLLAIEAVYPIGRYAELTNLLRTCQFWPGQAPAIRDVKGKLETPILLIGNDFDPATPFHWTDDLARTLSMESSLLRYEGGGHGASFRRDAIACIDDAARSYLVDRVLPAPGTSCPATPITFSSM